MFVTNRFVSHFSTPLVGSSSRMMVMTMGQQRAMAEQAQGCLASTERLLD
jgi:hypothetical protein